MDSPKDNSDLIGLDYKYGFRSGWINSFTFKSYYSHVDHLMNNYLRPNFVSMDASTPVVSDAYGGKLEFKTEPIKKMILYLGADMNAEARDGSRTRIIKRKSDGTEIPEGSRPVYIDSVWQDAHITDIGIFAEANYKIYSKLFVTAGLRTDFVSSHIDAPASGFYEIYGDGFDSSNENTIGGNLSLKYIAGNTNMQLAYGLGTRSASMAERYIWHMAISSDGYEYVGNPFLKAEKNNQIEFSVSQRLSKFLFGGSVFYSYIKDYISAIYKDGDANFAKIYSNVNPYAKQFVNVDAEQVGFEAFLDIDLYKNIKLNSNIAYTRAQNLTFDEPLAQVAPLTSHVGLKYENEKFWADVRVMFVAKQDRLALSFNETTVTPAYNTFDFRAGYKPLENLTIGLAVLNVFDKAYYTHLSYSYTNTTAEYLGNKIYEPGRSFSFYIKYKF
ncbi:MAG: TonB-dependent receptor [Saprospiraceae bacterium]